METAMKRVIFVLPLALAACDNGPSVTATNASTADIAAKTADMVKIEPGNWKTKVQILDISMPGMDDPRVADAMKQAMQSHSKTANEFNYCVTPEQAEKPRAEMFAGKDNGDCRYDSFTMAGGKIASKMTCKRSGGTMTMTMDGTYSPTAYAMTAQMTGIGPSGPGKAGSMTMKMQTNAERTGACSVDKKGTI
jgi:CheY-like chemotaxis protein